MLSLGAWNVVIHHLTLVIWNDTAIEDTMLSIEMIQMGIYDVRKTFMIPQGD